jgi:hypothetical protein
MKRSKKPLTFVAVAASIGALSLGLEACVYGPPGVQVETNVYGPPPETSITETVETEEEPKATQEEKPSDPTDGKEVVVYGPPSDLVDGPEEDVYGPPPEVEE